jgi:transmembrane sensor
MSKKQLRELLENYAKGECSPEEIVLLESWYLQHNEDARKLLSEDTLNEAQKKLWLELSPKINDKKAHALWPRIVVAASLLLFISVCVYFVKEKNNTNQTTATNRIRDIAPGTNKAILTLSNGEKISITGAKAGLIAKQGLTQISARIGEIVYVANSSSSKSIEFNTLTTPRGGQHQLTLADGTKVWLDAASSIKFPVAFSVKTREVFITGQVYFEVHHDKTKPFKVVANGQSVEVLGTHFNINSYADEPGIKTTLSEGSIKVSTDQFSHITLKPGQQSVVDHQRIRLVHDIDLEEVLAWHNGLFKFQDATVPEVMRQLSRWYNVEVAYEGKIPDKKFSGEIYRNVSALKLADMMSYENIHFRLEGNKIVVTP